MTADTTPLYDREERRRQAVKDSCELFDALSTEIYYGFTLRIVLAEATVTERQVLDRLLRRAEHARQAKPPRSSDGQTDTNG